MAGPFADLDAFLAEIKEEPPTMRLLGREWTLPLHVPASTMLDVERAMAYAAARAGEPEAERSSEPIPGTEGMDTLSVAYDICGENNVREWLTLGLPMKHLWAAITVARALHDGESPSPNSGGDEGKPAAPKSGASAKSSGRSAPSKRTSSASTGSTSRKSSG